MISNETRHLLLQIIETLWKDLQAMPESADHPYEMLELEKQIIEIRNGFERQRNQPGGKLDITKQDYIDLFRDVIPKEKIDKRIAFIDSIGGFAPPHNQ